MTEPVSLEDQARGFGDKVSGLLQACFPSAPNMLASELGGKVVIRPEDQTDKSGGVPLFAGGQQLAWLRVVYACRMDTTGRYLTVDDSRFWVVSTKDRTPIIRFEYSYEARERPHSHIHVHGERGSLSHLLARTRHKKPHEMSALHLPTGGARFRPDLEDVVQFLIAECQFDSNEGWQEHIDRRRAEWRAIQVRAVTRSMAEEAAHELESLGYTVTPPAAGHPEPGHKARFAW